MKILYFGGQKSGKSKLAEQKALNIASNKKPYYLATYDNSFDDAEMQERINKHKFQREDAFFCIEETKELSYVIKDGNTYLVDCMSMWILNMLDEELERIMQELEKLANKEEHIVFVLNDVSSGVIPANNLSRKYVDRSGIVGQKLAAFCDEVYEVKLGLEIRVK
jgi:adenosylcobinamide kinase/adenosylcobinamide-phosphate guanylyltransferase